MTKRIDIHISRKELTEFLLSQAKSEATNIMLRQRDVIITCINKPHTFHFVLLSANDYDVAYHSAEAGKINDLLGG